MKKKKTTKKGKGRLIGLFVVIILVIAGLVLIMRSSYGLTVAQGDTVRFSYTGKLTNGSVFAEGIREGTIGSGDMKVQFDEALTGMRIGETGEVVLEPRDGYGEYDTDKIMQTARYWAINRTKEFRLSVAQEKLLKGVLSEGEEILLRDMDWPVLVDDIDEGDGIVVVKHNPVNGSLYYPFSNPFPIKIIGITQDHVLWENMATIGMEVTIESSSATVIGIGENTIIYDTNHPLAGKTLVFSITLLDIDKAA